MDAETIRRAHNECPITAIQSEYSLMWRKLEISIFPTLQELGIGFVAYSPLNRGVLGGDITEFTAFDACNDNRAELPRFSKTNLRHNLRFLEVLHTIGKNGV